MMLLLNIDPPKTMHENRELVTSGPCLWSIRREGEKTIIKIRTFRLRSRGRVSHTYYFVIWKSSLRTGVLSQMATLKSSHWTWLLFTSINQILAQTPQDSQSFAPSFAPGFPAPCSSGGRCWSLPHRLPDWSRWRRAGYSCLVRLCSYGHSECRTWCSAFPPAITETWGCWGLARMRQQWNIGRCAN